MAWWWWWWWWWWRTSTGGSPRGAQRSAAPFGVQLERSGRDADSRWNNTISRRGSATGELGCHVPDLGEENWQLFVLELEAEAHLAVLVAEGPQLGQHGQQSGENRARIRSAPVVHVRPQRLQIDLLNLLHLPALEQVRPLCKKTGESFLCWGVLDDPVS